MSQSTITSYFASRKRPTSEALKTRSKIMVLDSDAGYGDISGNDSSSQPTALLKLQTTVVYKSDNEKVSSPKQHVSSAMKPKTARRTGSRKQVKSKEDLQCDMKSFLNPKAPGTQTQDKETNDKAGVNISEPLPQNVVFEMRGLLSPRKNKQGNATSSVMDQENSVAAASAVKENSVAAASAVKVSNAPDKKESNVQKARKELSLGDIKSRLNRSSRMAELQASLSRMEQGQERLKQIEESKRKLFGSEDTSKSKNENGSKPQLNQFNSIQLEVPTSPIKSPLKSPFKSPQKSSPGSSSPAFKRYSSLALPGIPALPLPYTYRHLAELFRCVDTVASLLFNRNELITFTKLQPAVQEMSRKTFTMHHIAQILAIYPEAYSAKQVKMHRFATPSKQDKYYLVLAPVLSEQTEDGAPPSMTPSLLLERRRHFYSRLLEIVKQHHDDFLKSLDPPLIIPRHKLTRWHPEFLVDDVPDVVPASLPAPPNQDRCSSAKDVLEKARQLYSCNARMEKALETVAQRSAEGRDVHVQIVDAQPTPKVPPSSPFKNLQLSSALKGIPKALLEKVRARQAAKALIAMTRTPAQDKEAIQYSRLPEIAKILRNTFVAEKKGTLPLDLVLEKVGDSYRSSLSTKELEEHLQLLAKAVPGWVSFEHLLKTNYLKLSKGGDMNRVLARLDELAAEKAGVK